MGEGQGSARRRGPGRGLLNRNPKEVQESVLWMGSGPGGGKQRQTSGGKNNIQELFAT